MVPINLFTANIRVYFIFPNKINNKLTQKPHFSIFTSS